MQPNLINKPNQKQKKQKNKNKTKQKNKNKTKKKTKNKKTKKTKKETNEIKINREIENITKEKGRVITTATIGGGSGVCRPVVDG